MSSDDEPTVEEIKAAAIEMAIAGTLQAHPFANMFPMLNDAEAAELADSVARLGLLEPIVIFHMQILDGRNRYKALVDKGVMLALDDCLLWLWCTWPHLPQGLEVLAAWGFTYATGGAWHKKTRHGKTAFGTGYRLRSACEPFLIGTIGNPKNTRGTRNLVEDLVREHSRKPDAAYRAAEALMPNVARLDLFSREERPGWLAWGFEARKFNATHVIQAGTRTGAPAHALPTSRPKPPRLPAR